MSSEHGSNILLRLRKGGPVRSGARREMPRSHHNQYNANAITDNIITSMVGIYIYIYNYIILYIRIFAGCELCLWILYFQIKKNRTFTGCEQHLVADFPEIFRRSTSGYPIRVEPTGRVRGSWHFFLWRHDM